MIHTVQNKLVLKLVAVRVVCNPHPLAGWSLPLSFYPLSLSLSLRLSVTKGSNVGVGAILLTTSAACTGNLATYSPTTAGHVDVLSGRLHDSGWESNEGFNLIKKYNRSTHV